MREGVPEIIDAVVNIHTREALAGRPDRRQFLTKPCVDQRVQDGFTLEEMLEDMDEGGIDHAFLIAAKVGGLGPPACYDVPYELVADAVRRYPKHFSGLAGVDPTEGMAGVRQLERAVKEHGFISAHSYPHWFELAPDHARYYPFYAKCFELDAPIQLQVGQSHIYDPRYPRRSVGRPITLDAVAYDFPEFATSNVPVRAIATIAHLSPFWVISSAAKSIDNPKQMEGKTIGVVSRGGGTDNYLDILLTVSGLPRDAVKRQVSGNSPSAFDLVELGRLDGFIADETVPIMLRRAGKKVKAWRVDDYASIPGQVYIASNEGISAHKDALIAYLKGVHEAIEFILPPGHMDKVMDDMKGFDLQELRQPDVAKLSVEAQAELWLAAGPQNILRNMPEKWAKGWKEMADAGLVKMGDPKTAYTNELVKAAL